MLLRSLSCRKVSGGHFFWISITLCNRIGWAFCSAFWRLLCTKMLHLIFALFLFLSRRNKEFTLFELNSRKALCVSETGRFSGGFILDLYVSTRKSSRWRAGHWTESCKVRLDVSLQGQRLRAKTSNKTMYVSPERWNENWNTKRTPRC